MLVDRPPSLKPIADVTFASGTFHRLAPSVSATLTPNQRERAIFHARHPLQTRWPRLYPQCSLLACIDEPDREHTGLFNQLTKRRVEHTQTPTAAGAPG